MNAEAKNLDDENPCKHCASTGSVLSCIWVVIKIMVPLWVPIIIRHPIFRVPKKGP